MVKMHIIYMVLIAGVAVYIGLGGGKNMGFCGGRFKRIWEATKVQVKELEQQHKKENVVSQEQPSSNGVADKPKEEAPVVEGESKDGC